MVGTHYPACAPVRTRVSAFLLWAVRCKINDIDQAVVDFSPSLVWPELVGSQDVR